MSISRLQPGPMQGILRGLVEGLMQATSGQQLSRAYLYGALLYYLQLTNEQAADHFTGSYPLTAIPYMYKFLKDIDFAKPSYSLFHNLIFTNA